MTQFFQSECQFLLMLWARSAVMADAPAGDQCMPATLFRRSALHQIRFRWEGTKCECRCCVEDLRNRQFGIAFADPSMCS